MKDKDLDRNLENIIIDGLIKEAEQDNADFAAAMRKMSDEEFESIVREPVFADYDDDWSSGAEESFCKKGIALTPAEMKIIETPSTVSDFKASRPIAAPPKKSKPKVLRPWITAAISAAAVILIVLIPSINSMNAKLCDSALYMSEAYITAPKGGFDISSATVNQIEEELPNLEKQYQNSIGKSGNFVHYSENFKDAGWTLAIAYLKLHKKGKAIEVLKALESQTHGTPFGDHCAKILQQLD